MTRLARLVWPIVDDDMTRTQLIAEADPLVGDVCAQLGVFQVGMAREWEIVTSGAGVSMLRCLVPVETAVEARDRQLADLVGRRFTDVQIAARLGVSKQTVWRSRTRLGLSRAVKDDLDVTAAVASLHAAGLSDAQSAEVCGVSRTTVWRIRAQQLGLAAAGSGGRPRKSTA